MDSPYEMVSKRLKESTLCAENTSDMSPVTDLAFNLKSLTTEFSGTPTRRISWSDPFANNGIACCDLSPAVDSPMLQEILIKNTMKIKRVASRKILPLDIGDKENVPPKLIERSESVVSSENDSIDISNSQDSGYSSSCGNRLGSATPGITSRVKAKSSVFSISNEGFDGNFFPLEDDIEMETTTELNMNSLLTKPLCKLETPEVPVRKGKLPARRCLTLEMESSDFSPMRLDSSSEISSNIDTTDTSDVQTDLIPRRRYPFKRPDTFESFTLQCKRRKSSPSVTLCEDDPELSNFVKQRSFSETAATIMQAVQISDLKPDLIGDCSRCYALPVVKGRHQDLKCISAETLVKLLLGEYKNEVDRYTLIDCRYPYEYEGGHILGAKNIYTKEEILEKFLTDVPEQSTERHVIIFHCEFSSERAPNLCRFLRNKDRELNECSYPKLHHPEIYILEGGYKAFFANFKEYCEPQDYKPMNHKDHGSDLRLFRAKSKSFSDSRSWHKMKSSSVIINNV